MCLYRLWLIAFDEASSWILDNEFARTFVIFGDDKSLLYYANNSKKSWVKGRLMMILMTTLVQQKKCLLSILVKQRQHFS